MVATEGLAETFFHDEITVMKKTIQNEYLVATVNSVGAELCSLKDRSGVEYIWQADPRVWPRHCPVLFPVVGKLVEQIYRYGGKEFRMPRHGFARDKEFQLVDSGRKHLEFKLLPDEDIRSQYPFEFELTVKYLLEENGLDVRYIISNPGEDILPFSIGAHPAFSCSWKRGDSIGDFYLEFEKQEEAERHFLEDGLLSERTEKILENDRILKLDEHTFDQDALLFMDIHSHRISLCSHKHKTRLALEYPSFPFVAIWSKPKAKFVSIAPWLGHADPVDMEGEIMTKPGIKRLDAGDSHECIHRIVIS